MHRHWMLCPAYRGVICMRDIRFESGISEESVILVYNDASLDDRFPMFRGNVLASFSRSEMSKNTQECLGYFYLWKWGHYIFSKTTGTNYVLTRRHFQKNRNFVESRWFVGGSSANVTMRKQRLSSSSFVDVAKFNSLKPLSLMFLCRLSLRIFCLKIRTPCIYTELYWHNFRVALKTWPNTCFISPCKMLFE
jgi:hypothetical protein